MKLSSRHLRLGEALGDVDGDELAETEAVPVCTSLALSETKPSVRAEDDREGSWSGQCENEPNPVCSHPVTLVSGSLSGDAVQ